VLHQIPTFRLSRSCRLIARLSFHLLRHPSPSTGSTTRRGLAA
jgi:hypothetical protein